MIDLKTRREVFAEEIQVCGNLRTPALVEALATVPRENFLGPGPWTILSEGDVGRPPRQTADADPKHLYHNVAVAIDPARQLFNGAPGLVTMAIDALSLERGARVLHIGAGLGYYSGLIAHAVGPAGCVVAIEIDDTLAARARQNLAAFPWAEVQRGDGTEITGSFDGILVNAGVTHPQESWLNALNPRARLVIPLTATFPKMGPIGKGLMIVVSKREAGDELDARVLTMVAIYSALGLRDDLLNDAFGKVLMRGAMAPLTRLRRDPHEPGPSCWFHAGRCCFSTGA